MDKTEEQEKKSWKNENLFSSIKNALFGIRHILKSHYNARLIFLSAILGVVLGFYFGVSNLEMFVLGVAIMIVFISEVINTIVEDLSNLITQEFHPRVKIIKDVAAGVVLVALFFSLVLGYCVFIRRVLILWKQ